MTTLDPAVSPAIPAQPLTSIVVDNVSKEFSLQYHRTL